MRTVLLAALFCTALLAVEPPKFSTPEPDLTAEDLRAPGPDDKIYPLPQDAAKSRELRDRRAKWFRAQLLEPYEAASPGKGAAEGKKALETVIAFYVQPSPRKQWLADARDTALKAAIKAGCDDPVVHLYHTRFLPAAIAMENAETFGELAASLEKAKAGLLPRILAHFEHGQWLLRSSEGKTGLRKEARKSFETALRLLVQLAKTKDPVAESAVLVLTGMILTEYQRAGWGRDKGYEFVAEAFGEADLEESLLKTLEGQHFVDYAWDARGTGPSENVTEEQWSEFKSRLKSAQTALEAAWKANSERPETASLMIAVCTGLQIKRSTMEEWFARAMKLDPDSYSACMRKMTYLEPAWQGSVHELLGFGRQCLRSKNFDAGLPFVLVSAHRVLAQNKLAEHVKQHDIAWADVREVYEHALQSRPDDRQLLCEYGLLCEAVGHHKAAQEHLASVKGKFFDPPFKSKSEFDAAVKRISEKVKEKK